MKIVRAKRAIFVLAALLSLFGSTLAACGCSHHEAAAVPVKASCHGASHETGEQPENVDQNASGDNVETECSCFVNEPSPALSLKSRVPTDNSNDEPLEQLVFEGELVVVARLSGTADHYSLIPPYSSHHSTRAPARAPPRL